MSKRVLRFGLGVVIVLLLLVLLYRNRYPFGSNNTSFAAEPKDEITKIELSGGKKKVTIEKKGNEWLLNGEIETRKTGVLFLIRVLEEIKIKSTVSPELFESEITAKGIEPVGVKVFEGRKLIRSFLVYKTPSNKYGNIMKMKSRSKPFIVYMSGFEGNIGSVFTLNELFWQPYSIFNLLPSEIASVDFENISDTVNSFTISNTNRKYNLSSKSQTFSGWDSSLVERYLSYFIRVPFESWAFEIDAEEKKEIEKRKPIYRISVATTRGTISILTLWEKLSGEQGSIEKDSDRLFGKTETNNDFFVIRYFDIDPLLKKRSYFFPR